MNDIVKPAVTLLIITTVAAFLLAVVNGQTTGPIEEQEILTEQTAMKVVLPDASDFPGDMILENDASFDGSSIIKVAKGTDGQNVVGYAITSEPNGFGGAVTLMIGIDTELNVKGIDVLAHTETPGLGANADRDEFKNQFVDIKGPLNVIKSGAAGENDIMALTGATITTDAVTNAVNEAIAWAEANGGGN